jgi:hypothetical protein
MGIKVAKSRLPPEFLKTRHQSKRHGIVDDDRN